MVAKIAYRSEMYLVKDSGEEVLLGYVDWDQETEALEKADGIYLMLAMDEMEEELVSRLLNFNHFKRNG